VAVGVLGITAPGAGAYFAADCQQFQITTEYGNSRTVANSQKIIAVSTQATFQDLFPCTGVYTGYWSLSAVFPANLQKATTDSTHVVQLGFGESCASGCWLPGITPSFLYTPSDASGGVLAKATWAPTPVLGRTYTFQIRNSTYAGCGGCHKWDYRIVDNVTGVNYAKLETATWNDGKRFLWFYEVKDPDDALGVRAGDAPAAIFNMQAQLTTGTVIFPPNPQACTNILGPPRSYYQCVAYLYDDPSTPPPENFPGISGYTTNR
jgi:hypothetical protein